MTYDDGKKTGVNTQAEITESLIRLLTRLVISIGVIGAFLIVTVQGNTEAARMLQPIALAEIGLWTVQGTVSTWAGVQHERTKTAQAVAPAVNESIVQAIKERIARA